MSFVAVAVAGIGAAAGLAGSAIASSGAKSAAKTQAEAASQATAEQQRQYNQTRSDLSPWTQSGTAAASRLNALAGLGNESAISDPYYAQRQDINAQIADLTAKAAKPGIGFMARYYNDKAAKLQSQLDALPAAPTATTGTATGATSADIMAMDPGYQFRLSEGQKGIERSAASRTGTLSGAATKAMSRYNQDYASNEFGNVFNRLNTLSSLGQNAAAQVGNLGAQTASQVGSNIIGAGNATAAGQVASGQIWGNTIAGLGNNLSQLLAMRQSGYSSPTLADLNTVDPTQIVSGIPG
jgi:hypothetical protein